MKTTENNAKCPDKLAELIDRVNLVSIDIDLPDIRFSEYFYMPIGEVPNLYSYPQTDLSMLPTALIKYLATVGDKSLEFYPEASPSRKELLREAQIGYTYQEFRDLHNNFKQLVRATSTPESHWLFHIPLTSIAYIDENGIIQEVRSEFYEAIIGINCERVRTCCWCKKIYWAERIGGNRDEGKFCSKRCSDNMWAKKHRLDKSIKELEIELNKERTNLTQRQLKDVPKSLISEQEIRVKKLEEKLEQKRRKLDGTL